jgi:uncharacterized protein
VPPTGLSVSETRVLGCLIEKQRTTPDQYPLTLNSLRLACNQSTNRDPVVDYDEATIREALHRLERRGLVRLASGPGSRAPKYRHLLADAMPLPADEQSVMCVLMLRGPQTPGELKQRTDRMHAFADLAEVTRTLDRLIEGALARRLDRRPGQKEERFCELLTGEGAEADTPADAFQAPAAAGGVDSYAADDGFAPATPRAPTEDALGELRERVERLEREVALLRGTGEAGDVGVPADAGFRPEAREESL